jgi:hypothetical protein
MPRRSKGIRLWLRPGQRDARGKHVRVSTWLIIDGDKRVATGRAASEIREAQVKLSEYIASKYQPKRRERDVEDIDIADVLSIYAEILPMCFPFTLTTAVRGKQGRRNWMAGSRVSMNFGAARSWQT